MFEELLHRIGIFSVLHEIDKDLAQEHRSRGCIFCGGPLHQGNYVRKPRGGPEDIPEEHLIRQSTCCGREGCRRRSLPPSCLFLGRRIYWAPVILLVTALRQLRPESWTARKIMLLFDISRKTFLRWARYWREVFPQSAQWKKVRGRVSAQVMDAALPGAILNVFIEQTGNEEEALVRCLRFLAAGLSDI